MKLYYPLIFILVTSLALLSCEPEKQKMRSFTVYAKYSNIYYYNTQPDNLFVSWPGKEMIYAGDGWFKHQFKGQSTATLSFNAWGSNATKEYNRSKTGWFVDGRWYDKNPDKEQFVLRMNKEKTGIKKGEQEQLYAHEIWGNEPEKLQWTSENPKVATVDENGLVTAVGLVPHEKETNIKASLSSTEFVLCNVEISEEEIEMQELKLSYENIETMPEDIIFLDAIPTPLNATNQEFEWTSSAPNVATVDNSGRVKTLSVGNTIITAKKGEKSASCKLDVQKTKNWTFDASEPYFKVDFGLKNSVTYTIKNIKNKSLFLVRSNSSPITPVASLDAGEIDNRSVLNRKLNGLTILKHEEAESFNANPPKITAHNNVRSRGGAARSIEYTVGDKKDFWVQRANASWTKRNAILKGIGENIMIWVDEANWGDGDNQIHQNHINCLISHFDGTEDKEFKDGIYGAVTNVFGYEYGGGPEGDGGVDGEQKIQVLVYDIDFDYTATQTGGVFGFFWAKDYYTQEQLNKTGNSAKTNLAEIFYLDANFTSKNLEFGVSTLAHEYQHMIHFNQKFIKYGLTSEVWFNEMFSLICEDMVASIIYDESHQENALGQRLDFFKRGYYLSGVNNWLPGQKVYYSYATTYLFGAYLCRNFGDVTFLHSVLTNNYVNIKSLDMALEEQGSKFTPAFEHWGVALLTSNEEPISVNKKVESSREEINYVFEKIDLFGNGKTPYAFKLNEKPTLMPLGISIHQDDNWKNVDVENLVVTFNKPLNSNVNMFLVMR